MAATDEGAFVDHPLIVPDSIEYRPYQRELASAALSAHTLVSLPTGLGKTAVSFLVSAERLTELGGKVLLLAPTKPLVQQHADDYRSWFVIPDEEIVVFTGEVRPDDRQQLWEEATVIVATPQVIENDLIGGRISLTDVVHCTFDECHRATGSYAYTYIADQYHDEAAQPLVTGLSASPGDDTDAILKICSNLGIEQVEVRTEDDEEVAKFAHDTDVEWVHIDLPEEIRNIRDKLVSVIGDRLSQLQEVGVTKKTDPNLSERDLQRIRGQLQELIDKGESVGYTGMSVHAEIRKLKTAVMYVETQGVEALRRYFDRQKNAARSSGASKASQRFVSDIRVKQAMQLAELYDDIHPKFRRTRMLIAETLGIENGDRVIVFTESRDTAETLTAFLNEHFSTRRFVGQNDREGSAGMTQQEQREVLSAFRNGDFEVLVSTSVAEEGLDVPEVDLVLFYEPVPTAIRSIQRKGRTGRQSKGRVVVLIAKDTRDEAYFWISRRREKKMHEELRSLKSLSADLEGQLEAKKTSQQAEPVTRMDKEQAGLTEFSSAMSESHSSSQDQQRTVTVPPPEKNEGGETSIEIVVDQRELNATIAKELSRRDEVSVRLETLEIGDYVVSDRVAVERKSVSDFLETLTGDNRSLFEQIRDLTQHYTRPVLIIEGAENLYEVRNIHPNAIRGALASLAVDFGVSVLRTTSERDTLELLLVLARREQISSTREVRLHGEKTTKTLAEQQEYVVSSIAEVGPVTARALLAAFGSVEAVLTADADALQEVEGIGVVTADRIRTVVESEYNP